MNILILKILFTFLGGIILGLYFKSIALFVFIGIMGLLIYKEKYEELKFVFVCILIFGVTFYINEKYENLYIDNTEYSRNSRSYKLCRREKLYK